MRSKMLPVLALLLLSLSCSDKKEATREEPKPLVVFDKEKWQVKKGWDYPHRDSMLEDLMTNDLYRELKRDALLEMLGAPSRVDSSYLFYMIDQKRLGLWPLHTKTLVIKFSGDSTINWMKIHE